MGTEEVHTGIKWENLREVDHLKDPGVDGRTILKRMILKLDGGTDLKGLAQDMDR
jgi:hypothetical protein